MAQPYFERLPPELLLPIFSRLSGLECLDSLLRASPAAYRVFDTYGAEIFEPLLSKGEIHQFTVSLIRITAYLRTSSLPPHVHDLFTLRNCLAGETTAYRWEPPRWEHPPCPLPTGITATALRGLLASHRKVVALTVGSLEYYLGLFNASKPAHLADREFFYALEHGDGWKCDYVGAWQPDPPPEPCPLRGAGGPPTWVEEQRVMRACWRLELFESARVGIEAGRLPWPPDVDIYEPHLRGMGTDPRTFYDPMLGAPGWSHRRRRGPPGRHEEGDVDPHPTTEPAHDLDAELMTTVQTYLAEHRPSLAALARARRSWRVPAPEGPGDLDALGSVSGVLLFYHDDDDHDDASGGGGEEDPAAAESHASSPIRHVSFEPFRRAGFAIWSERRLRAGEAFGSPTLWQRWEFDCCLAAWRGVLTPAMLREMVGENATGGTAWPAARTNS